MKAGEGFEFVECANRLEYACIQLYRGMCAEYAGAAAAGFLEVFCMRGAVGAEEEPGTARSDRSQQRLPVSFAFEHG